MLSILCTLYINVSIPFTFNYYIYDKHLLKNEVTPREIHGYLITILNNTYLYVSLSVHLIPALLDNYSLQKLDTQMLE